MHIQLLDIWLNEEIPLVNGIIYADGRIDLLDVNNRTGNKEVRYIRSTTLQELYESNEIDCSSIMINCQMLSPNGKYKIFCGDGSFGGDGFIAVKSENDQKLEWVAFFEDSNPFIDLLVDDEFVYGVTSLNEKWTFNIINPTDVKISEVE